MKKTIAMLAAAVALGAFCVQTGAGAAATKDNWTVSLTFSTPNHADILPVVIGESPSAIEKPKPPSFPGKAITNDVTDSVINAYVKSSSKKIAESLGAADANAPGKAWAIEVITEDDAGTKVSVTPNLANKFADYKLTVIDPADGKRTELTSSNTPVEVFTADSTGKKTLFILASSQNSFALADSGNLVVGASYKNVSSTADLNFFKVYVDGSEKATTASSGVTNSGIAVAQGDHTVKISAPYMLSAVGTLSVDANGTGALAMTDPLGGDIVDTPANMKGVISLHDFMKLKQCFGKKVGDVITKADGSTVTCADEINIDRDKQGLINLYDFTILKSNFGKKEPQ